MRSGVGCTCSIVCFGVSTGRSFFRKFFQPQPTFGAPARTARQVAFVEAFPRVLTLPRLRELPALADFALLRKGNRLSVMPVSAAEWAAIVAAALG